MSRVTRVPFKIRIDEVDQAHRLSISALARYLQEAAWEASVQREGSVNDLRAQGMTWILTRLQLELLRIPAYLESIEIETWGSSSDKFFVYRDFRMYASNGELLGRAISSWLIVDVASGQMIRMPQEVVDKFITDHGESFSLKKAKIPALQSPENSYDLEVRWSDLDINEHSNNTHYYRWALDALKPEIHQNKEFYGLDIQFKAESKLGDHLKVQVEKESEGVFIHQIFNESSQKECVRMRSLWK